ncbi:MAG: Tn7 transposase TnsA N-terminal domain-containing protein [Rhodanobacteraceae bacterium]|nr:Tn7 transposase TnsA N-terminal domain-containing protein [Rhodanobacteraceae bacterium]
MEIRLPPGWSDAVADYYEQFPLLPLEETIVLAERLGVSLPVEDGEPRVRTTDFVIDVEVSGIQTRQARSIKPASELQVKKTVLLLEIERRYWESQDHGLGDRNRARDTRCDGEQHRVGP